MANLKKLRILCFGDSLTEGYSGWGSSFTPYSEKLEEMLTMAFPDVDVEIETDGLSGDMVTGRAAFLARMKLHCKLACTHSRSQVEQAWCDYSH